MNPFNRFIVLIVGLLFVILLSCTAAEKNKPHLKVAALLKSSTNPYFSLMWEGIKSEADRSHIAVELFWPQNESDFNYQYEFLKYSAFKYDFLILSPSNVDGVASYLPPLKKVGKKIIILDAEINRPSNTNEKEYYDAFIGTDNEAGGELAAEFAESHLPKIENVVILGGFPVLMNTPGRTLSFKKRILMYHPNAKIASFTADYDRDQAKYITKQNINTFLNSDIIFCANDHMALGVIDILSGNAMIPAIIGYDSIREAQQAILEDKLMASVIQFPARMGAEAIKAIIAISEGKVVPTKILIKPEMSIRKVTLDSMKLDDLKKLRKNENAY